MKNFFKWLNIDKSRRNSLIVKTLLGIAFLVALFLDTPSILWTSIMTILITGFMLSAWLMEYLIYKRVSK